MKYKYNHARLRLGRLCIGLAIPLSLTVAIFAAALGEDANANPNSQLNTKQMELGDRHDIILVAKELENGLFAYQMESHLITQRTDFDDRDDVIDVTSRYSPEPTIPGPTLVISEGDEVFLTIHNGITAHPDQQVSVHVHGVHYRIDSDGTRKELNRINDQGAYPENSDRGPKAYTYKWTAAPGTAGSWPYHDHNFGDINGAETRGLFGAVIVNPASDEVAANINNTIQNVPLSSIAKDYVLYLGDDAFWGMEIDGPSQQQTPLWANPTLVAKQGENVRFHLIALGTDFHEFRLTGYHWIDPGTQNLINKKDIGPLENHVFTIQSQQPAQYMDMTFSNKLMGMRGNFAVNGTGESTTNPSLDKWMEIIRKFAFSGISGNRTAGP